MSSGRVVLFDLDGTLTDPAKGICNSLRHAIDVLGLAPMTDVELRRLIGPPLRDSFADLGLSPTGVEAAIVAYRSYFADAGLYENVPYPGIETALGELTAGGDRLAVATSKPTVFAKRIIEHFELDRHFQVVVGAELDGARSDKSEVIAETLQELSAPADRAVMVGDREHDVVGAAAHGMSCVGVSWGYAAPGELEAAGACQVIDRPEELLPAVRSARIGS